MSQTREAIWSPESDSTGGKASVVKLNSDESDSDFDDVEVDLSSLRKQASSSPDASAVDEANKIFGDKYGMYVADSDNLPDLIVLGFLQNQVNDAAEKLKSTPSAENNKAYKQSLQTMLNHRAHLIQKAHNAYIVPGDMKEDWALTADSLLSVGELKLINQSIKPVDGDLRNNPGKKTTYAGKKLNRKNLPTWQDTLDKADKFDENNKANPIVGLPDNWSVASMRKRLEDGTSEKRSVVDTLPVSESLKQALTRGFALGEMSDYFNLGTMIISDSSGNYVGSFIINGVGGSRVTSDVETLSIISSLDSAGAVMHLPGTDGPGSANNARGFTMFVTNRGKEWSSKGFTQDGVLGYANPNMGITVLADSVRASKKSKDSDSAPLLDGSPDAWFSTPIAKNSMDVWEHVVTHEVGHMVAFRTLLSDSEMGQGSAPSKYGRESEHENFAEYYAKYIRTGNAPDWFMETLRSRGLLKSQQNQ